MEPAPEQHELGGERERDADGESAAGDGLEPPEAAAIQASERSTDDHGDEQDQRGELGNGAERQSVEHLEVRGREQEADRQEGENPTRHRPGSS
jgi:hypothetical protein